MNKEMAYLLGMIVGNGIIQRGSNETTISIDIPHKTAYTESGQDVLVYVMASVADIKRNLDPLIGFNLDHNQRRNVTTLSFNKSNQDYLIREITRMIGSGVVHHSMRIPREIFQADHFTKLEFLRGLADVTAYIRKSNNAYGNMFQPRVYIEVPRNWDLVIDISNLLKIVDIPVQNIDWAHPNMRDGNLRKLNQGQPHFWKKEHQIKIFALEFLPISFGIRHKQEALEDFADLQRRHLISKGENPNNFSTHRFYWETPTRVNMKPIHPAENDDFIPLQIRGNHYNTWREIAEDLGYGE